jgi:NAD(P)-dependent dehydrogenase (short-subunit alcohol dehydrogenase family)
MSDLILTGASRGIGRALALALASPELRLVLVARDRERLDAVAREVASRGGRAEPIIGDLSSVAAARELGDRLAGLVGGGATLVHNAGLWPHRRRLTAEGFEEAFAVNCLGPLALQEPLLAAGTLRRILVVSAGLIGLGHFDPARTPTGEDFSGVRTYCNTKLAFAVAMRSIAADYPELDVLVLHPGVVRTELGDRPGPIGWLLRLAKRKWETPDACAARLAGLLRQERWSPPGRARWLVVEREQRWPASADRAQIRNAVRETTARLLAARFGRRRAG